MNILILSCFDDCCLIMLLIIQLKRMVALKDVFAIKVVGRLEQRIKDLETQFDEEQRRLVDAERWV